MRKIAGGFTALSLVCLVGAAPALAREGSEMTEHVTFYQDVIVNNTVVKHGTYKLEFDPASGQLFIKSGKRVVAAAPASLRVNERKAEGDVVYTRSTEMGEELQAVKYGGQREEVVLNNSMSAQASAEPNYDVAYYEEYFYNDTATAPAVADETAAAASSDDCDVASMSAMSDEAAVSAEDESHDSVIPSESAKSDARDGYDAEPPVDD